MNNTMILLVFILILGGSSQLAAKEVPTAPNGIPFPADYMNWQLISSSSRTDNNTLRVILGNEIAVNAARSGNTDPWPNGAMLGKVVWKQVKDKHWPAAIVPDKFVHVEFMLKDAVNYKSTGGWGYARWVGRDLKVYGKDPGFANECFTCHAPVKDEDYVFTRPAPLFNGSKK